MKNIIYLLILISSIVRISAQNEIEIILRVLPPYPIQLEAYQDLDNVLIEVRNTTSLPQNLKFQADLTGDNGLSATSEFDNMVEPVTIGPNMTNVYTGMQIQELGITFTEDDINTSGVSQETLNFIEFNRQLPEGNYTLCVQAFDFDTEVALSMSAPSGCDSWDIVEPDRPQIIMPADESTEVETESDLIQFFWTGVQNGVVDPTRIVYDLRVVDLEDYPSVDPQLLMMEQAADFILYEVDLNTTSFISNGGNNSEEIDFIAGHHYAVMVSARDLDNDIDYQFQNHSEVITFTYGDEGVILLGEAEPPVITFPFDEDFMEETAAFIWTPANDPGKIELTNLKTLVSFIDITEHNNGNNLSLPEFKTLAGTDNELDENIQLVGNFSSWSVGETGSHITSPQGDSPTFTRGHKYAMIVYCEFTDGYPVKNEGFSQIVHFEYGNGDKAEPPVITFPFDEDFMEETAAFIWTPANDPGKVELTNLKTLVSFIDVTEHNNGNNLSLPEFKALAGTDNELDENIQLVGNFSSWSVGETGSHITSPQGDSPTFTRGHKYAMIVYCEFTDGYPVKNEGFSQIVHFIHGNGEEAYAPVIINPEDQSSMTTSESFDWSKAYFPGKTDLTKLRTLVSFIDITTNHGNAELSLSEFKTLAGTDHELDENIQIEGNFSGWVVGETGDHITSPQGPSPTFVDGNKYAMVVFCEFTDDYPVLNGGFSQVVHFVAGEGTYSIDDFNKNTQYPAEQDTLPFTGVQLIVDTQPHDEDIIKLEFLVNMKVTDQSEYIYERGPESNNWSGGIGTYMANKHPDGKGNHMYSFWLNIMKENEDLVKGQSYQWHAELTTTKSEGDTHPTQTIDGTFVTGMTTPILQYPEHDSEVALEEITLKFKTGNAPKNLLPEYSPWRIKNSQKTQGGQQGIKEKYVVQLSTDPNFSNDVTVVKSDVLEIVFAIGETNDEQFVDQIYKDLTVPYTPQTAGDYYWRVGYLKTDKFDTATDDLVEDDFYRLSRKGKFTVSAVVVPEAESTCEDNCTYTIPPAESTPASGSMATVLSGNGNVFKLGKFDVTVLESNENGAALTGKGIVKINLGIDISVNVNFSNIKLNSNGRAVSGSAIAANDVPAFDIETWGIAANKSGGELGENAPGLNDLLNGVSSVSSLANEVRLISQLVSGEPIGMPLGIDSQIDGYKVLLGVTSMEFGVLRANCSIAAEFHIPPELMKGGNGRFGLKASDVCIIPSGFGKEFILSLSDDLKIPIDGNEFLSVKGSGGSTDKQDIINDATYIEVDCNGLKGVALRFEIAFPQDILILDERLLASDDPKDGIVHGKFGLSYRRGSSTNTVNKSENTSADPGSNMNFIIDFDMDPFQIKGLDGWGFTLEEGHIDLSTLSNPDGLEFPTGYDFGPAGSLTNTWQGFYLKKISVKVPDDFVKDEKNIESKLQVGLQKIIYDGQFSAEIFAQDIIEIHDGAMNGWAVSVDEFTVKFVQNSFVGGSLGGKFRLPVQEKDGHVAYSALLGETVPDATGNTKWGFVLNVDVVEEPIILPLFIAEASIKEGSYIHLATEKITIDPRKDEGQSFFIAGTLDIGGEAAKDLEAVLDMPGINYAIKYTQAAGWDTGVTKIGFASPQKYMGPATDPEGQEGGMSGFPITIENFTVTNGVIDPDSEIKGTFTFDVKINFMDTDDGGLSAEASMYFDAGWNTANSTFILDNFGVSCIGVAAEVGGVTLDGKVCFYNGTPPGCDQAPPSEGVKGIIKVGLPVAEINLAAEFGVASPEGEEPFRYWFVDGKVIISEGISMGTLSLYGISGGVYYNMALEDNIVTKNGIDVDPGLLSNAGAMVGGNDNKLPDQDPNLDDETYKAQLASTTIEGSGQTFCPAEGKMTFKAGLILGMAGDPSIFNMDVGVSASVDANEGLTSFKITGSGYVMADFDERHNAYVIADIEIGYQKVINEYEEYFANLEIFLNMNFEDFVQVTGDRGEKKTLGDIDSYSFLEANFKMKFLNGDPDPLWYFKMGEPKKRADGTGGPGAVAVEIGASGSDQSDENKANGASNAGVSIKSKFYMMAGNHDITPEFMELPTLISDMLSNPLTGEGENGLVGGNASNSEDGRKNPNDMMDAIVGTGTTSGFGMGFNIEIDLSVDFFLIYASLQAAAGFDLSITKPVGGVECSVTQPDGTRVISTMEGGGANGFYTKGRICAGIKGAMGVQLDIAGDKRKFEIFELGAAFMIEGGFPDPTWMQGTAVVMYSVMNGEMNGSARFEFRAGDVCIPPETDPFKIKMIEEILPDGSQDQSLTVHPKVRFAEPVNIVQSYPLIEQVEYVDGQREVIEGYWFLAPYVHRISLKEMDGTILSSVSIEPPKEPIINRNSFGTTTVNNATYALGQSGKVLTFFNEAELLEETEYKVVVEVRAVESVPGQNELQPVMVTSSDFWVEADSTTFTTGRLPNQIPYDNMISMHPMPLQKYFLKDEKTNGHIYTAGYNNTAKKYLTKEGLAGRGPRPDKIIARFTDVNSENVFETIINDATSVSLRDNYKGGGKYGYNGTEATVPCGQAFFSLPSELQNMTTYRLQFIAVFSDHVLDTWAESQNENGQVVFIDETLGTDTDSTIYSDIRKLSDRISLDEIMSVGGMLLHESYFKTSEYNTIEEKLTASNVEYNDEWIKINNSEPFDQVDIYGSTAYQGLIHRQEGYPVHLPLLSSLYTVKSAGDMSYINDLSTAKTRLAQYGAQSNMLVTGSKIWNTGYDAYDMCTPVTPTGECWRQGSHMIDYKFRPLDGRMRLELKYSTQPYHEPKTWCSVKDNGLQAIIKMGNYFDSNKKSYINVGPSFNREDEATVALDPLGRWHRETPIDINIKNGYSNLWMLDEGKFEVSKGRGNIGELNAFDINMFFDQSDLNINWDTKKSKYISLDMRQVTISNDLLNIEEEIAGEDGTVYEEEGFVVPDFGLEINLTGALADLAEQSQQMQDDYESAVFGEPETGSFTLIGESSDYKIGSDIRKLYNHHQTVFNIHLRTKRYAIKERFSFEDCNSDEIVSWSYMSENPSVDSQIMKAGSSNQEVTMGRVYEKSYNLLYQNYGNGLSPYNNIRAKISRLNNMNSFEVVRKLTKQGDTPFSHVEFALPATATVVYFYPVIIHYPYTNYFTP